MGIAALELHSLAQALLVDIEPNPDKALCLQSGTRRDDRSGTAQERVTDASPSRLSASRAWVT